MPGTLGDNKACQLKGDVRGAGGTLFHFTQVPVQTCRPDLQACTCMTT